jgi:hypothetical protein
MELNIELQTDELLRNYRWAAETVPQYHVVLYALWHLSIRPVGPNVERAWKAINGIFELEQSRRRRQDVGSTGPGIKWVVLAALKEKAARVRSSTISPSSKSSVEKDAVMTDPSEPWDRIFDGKLGMSWETGYLDWDSLVDGLNTDSEVALQDA